MTDAQIHEWLRQHHALVAGIMASTVGTLAGFVRLASDADFDKKHPYLAIAANVLKALCPDFGTVFRTILAAWIGQEIGGPNASDTTDTKHPLLACSYRAIDAVRH